MPDVHAKNMVSAAAAARRALLQAQALLGGPARGQRRERNGAPDDLQVLIEQMGFVQIDTINVVERAHHLTLFARMPEYQQNKLADLLEKRRTLWEHWTHDASAIPTQWFAHWRHRFERYRKRDPAHGWWQTRMGPNPRKVISSVLKRIEREGPLMSRDFEKPRPKSGPAVANAWWQWRPTKAALEYLWRCGELTVARRVNFQKVYDLTERILTDHHAQPAPDRDEHVAWACRSALERLALATPREIAAFWHAIDLATARAWCKEGLYTGELIEVVIESANGSKPVTALALADREPALRRAARNGATKRKTAAAPDAEPMRILSPFDPVLRDRARTLRLFNFDYRFEAFVPAPKRRYGYYVMPLLQGDRLVGRINPKFHRERGELAINGVWWEKGIKPTRARKAALDDALDRLARFIDAERVRIER